MKLSLIIPCYNEAANLPQLLERCAALGNDQGIEVILVDNGSTDSSPQVMQALLPKYPHCRSVRVPLNQGYGFGILSGLRAANGELLAWTHADMQTDPKDVLTGLAIYERFKSSGLARDSNIYIKGKRIKRPWTDAIFTLGMSIFETLLLGKILWDINAQPNIFSRNFFENWDNPPLDFSLDLYAYFMARKQGLPVHRFAVEFGERAHGVSHWNVNWIAKMKFIRRTIDFSIKLRRSPK